jgi:hypothetical protein
MIIDNHRNSLHLLTSEVGTTQKVLAAQQFRQLSEDTADVAIQRSSREKT